MRAELVGREAEMAVLTDSLAAALDGLPRVVVCEGEAGIGKTRLAQELLGVAERRGVLGAWGSAAETSGAPPFWPWSQVLRALEVPSAHVAGFSMGSAIALAPDREAGLSRPAASLIGSRRNSGLRRPGNQSRARGINPAIGCRWAPPRHRPSTDPHKARCRYRFDAGCRHIGHRGGPPGGANGSSAWKPCRSYSGLLRSLVASR